MNPRILIADDDESIRDIFRLIFSELDFALELISSGEDLLKNRFIVPDIFLIDKQLSGVNGLDVCRFLKEQSNTRHIPVIMISALPDIGTLSKEAGADGYIEKPFEITFLMEVINRYIVTPGTITQNRTSGTPPATL